MMRVLDLFSGIGGFSLGLEQTGGFRTVGFCEQDEKARRVLKKHWPGVPIFPDIRGLDHETLRANGIVPDIITGGFPCQDISCAGKGVGIIGERSGLWTEMFRLIRDVRPTWAIAENVSALRSKGLALVLQDLCSIGYRVEWHCIPASAVGAPHQRDRIWIVANAYCTYREGKRMPRGVQEEVPILDSRGPDGNACGDVAHALCSGQSGSGASGDAFDSAPPIQRQAAQLIDGGVENEWGIEPTVGRVAYGVPNRVDRLRQLGNAVVPQIPRMIGDAILSYMRESA